MNYNPKLDYYQSLIDYSFFITIIKPENNTIPLRTPNANILYNEVLNSGNSKTPSSLSYLNDSLNKSKLCMKKHRESFEKEFAFVFSSQDYLFTNTQINTLINFIRRLGFSALEELVEEYISLSDEKISTYEAVYDFYLHQQADSFEKLKNADSSLIEQSAHGYVLCTHTCFLQLERKEMNTEVKALLNFINPFFKQKSINSFNLDL